MSLEIDDYKKYLEMANEEWASDDTFIENICKENGVDEFEIFGDSFMVPNIQQKVESLVKKLGGLIPND